MKKTLLTFLISTVTLICFNCSVTAEQNVNVVLDGKTITFDVPAQIINGRTMVPVRKIFEELGMEVEWFEETQTVMATKQGVVVAFPIGSTTVSRNTVAQTIDVPAQLIGSRTLVPVRFVSEFTGAEVLWDGNTNTVFINSTDNIKQLNWNDTYDYWGEVENGKASGYGALYNKEDGSLWQMGNYIDSQIVVGSDFFDGGATYNGYYKNGKFAYGTFYFADGDSFAGEFNDGRMSDGIYNFSDGGYFTGKFDADERFSSGTQYFPNGDSYTGCYLNGLPNGYGIYYDAVENIQYEGNYTNGKRNGDFTIKNFYLNQTYYATYIDDIYIDEKQKNLIDLEKKSTALAAEYEALNAWYENELKKLQDYTANGDPFSTDFAIDIYNSIGSEIASSKNSLPNNSNFIDGTSAAAGAAAANALALSGSKSNAARQAILEYNQTYINQKKQLIEDEYARQKAILDSKQKRLLIEFE